MPKILIVEDHVDTANLMRIVLERRGFEVRFATTVADALATADREKFDVCICDYRLPDGDGASLSRELLQKHNVKSICLSGDAAATDALTDPNCAFAACLSKPLDIEKTLETIRAVIG
jgi:DNA-binding response OmpR family regulator